MTVSVIAKDISFKYGRGETSVTVLDGVSIEINRGKFVCLSGPSGSGKSTLLSILGLIEPLQTGVLYFDEKKIDPIDEKTCDQLRRYHIGYIFQDFQLFDVLTASENVEYFLTRQQLPAHERKIRIEHYLRAVGLWDLRNRLPSQLSGGQKQRLAIARSLAKRPKLIIADEPTANLDRENARLVLDTLTQLSREVGLTIIMATHDQAALEYCDLAVELDMGRAIIKAQDKIYAA